MGLLQPDARHRRQDGEPALTDTAGQSGTGRLAGIARHGRSRGPIEEISRVSVTRDEGLHGDARGAIVPGASGRRQVSLIEAKSWAAALRDLDLDEGTIRWSERRVNLLVDGMTLPREEGAIIRIGASLRIEVTMECNPCSRMEEIHPGLKAALTPDWRGGVLGRVLDDGDIAVGDDIRIER